MGVRGGGPKGRVEGRKGVEETQVGGGGWGEMEGGMEGGGGEGWCGTVWGDARGDTGGGGGGCAIFATGKAQMKVLRNRLGKCRCKMLPSTHAHKS